MVAFFKNPAIWVVLSYCALYFFSAATIGATEVKAVVDYGVLCIALMFFFSWLPNTFEAFQSGGNLKKFRLALGLALLAAGLAGQRFWIIIINQVGVADWVSRDMISGFTASWLAAGMLLCLSIDAKEEGLVPHLKFYYTGIVGAVCLVIGFLGAKVLFP